MLKFRFLSLVLLLGVCGEASAKRFANSYTEFELPVGWECFLEGSEYVCQSQNADRKKEAIIILAAKKRGAQDTLTEYQKYLGEPRVYQLPGNKKQVSEAKSVGTKMVNGHKWIDSLHLASEVPGFYTRYLATVKAGIGVAVTFSVTKNLYDAYKGIFDNVIASMRVFAHENKDLAGLRLGKKTGENFNDAVFDNQDPMMAGSAPVVQKEKKKEEEGGDFLFFVIIGVVGLLVAIKLKNKKKV